MNQQPHTITAACVAVHCRIHDVDEPERPGYYRACGECFHVFRTEAELVAAHNAELADLRSRYPQETGPADVTSGDAVFCCPHCVHDF